MPNYSTPGVYIQEVSTGAKPITMVGTSTAAFLGIAPHKAARPDQAFACNNWSQFVREFVGTASEDTPLSLAVYSFFNNGGSRCYVVNVGDGSIAGEAGKRSGLGCLECIDEIALVAAPGYCDPASYAALIDHCDKLEDRFAILDAPDEVVDIDGLKRVATVSSSSKPAAEEDASKKSGVAGKGLRCPASKNAAYYFPWIETQSPLARSKIVAAPPSGFMAGIYARSDATRGVHKAPANEPVNGALGLRYQVTRAEQGELNDAGVNCIRYFPNSGIRVWGARTVSSDPEWRYVNVRRLFLMVEESIKVSTHWVVFEPNDEKLWKSVVRDVSAFLTRLWRDGALRGSTPEQAFYVKCDAETNPPEVVDAGRLEVEIGLAPVKPSEFIVFRIGQWAGSGEGQSDEQAAQE